MLQTRAVKLSALPVVESQFLGWRNPQLRSSLDFVDLGNERDANKCSEFANPAIPSLVEYQSVDASEENLSILSTLAT